jgi:glycine/D-amino acid oxidase-like deaminating enzyme
MRCIEGSPWIQEMGERLQLPSLRRDMTADVSVVGAGIAGMSTAFRLLEGSDLSVIILEKDRIGHGASGRNAGQGIAVVERDLDTMVREMGEAKVASLLVGIETGHSLLGEICEIIGYDPAPVRTEAWSGLSDVAEVEAALRELDLRLRHGAPPRRMVISEEVSQRIEVDGSLARLVDFESPDRLSAHLRTREDYLAAMRVPVSLINSGKLCQAIARYLIDEHPERLSIFEGSGADRIEVGHAPSVRAGARTINARAVVLCTNGYPVPNISSQVAPMVDGRITQYLASMVAYESPVRERPCAFNYHHEEGDPREEPYFYLTRRTYSVNGNDLVAVGGPQAVTEGDLVPGAEIPKGVYRRIDSFMERSYVGPLERASVRCWNGLMGYTPDGLRMAGEDPILKGLWYNMGCNGVGLLPSLVAATQVAYGLKRSLIDEG